MKLNLRVAGSELLCNIYKWVCVFRLGQKHQWNDVFQINDIALEFWIVSKMYPSMVGFEWFVIVDLMH